MARVYKITNEINGKIYIGKTYLTIEERWWQHCKDYIKERNKNRPLYKAMKKYGTNNFIVELIEETVNAEEREKYWIRTLGTFKNGYNATLGGDGTPYIDYDLVVNTYFKYKNMSKTAQVLKINVDSVKNILRERKIDILTTTEICGKKVKMLKNDNEVIRVFKSRRCAARYLIENNYSNVKDVGGLASIINKLCNKEDNFKYGFKWENY